MPENMEPEILEIPSLPLVVGVSTRAMFDLEEEHAVFEKEGVRAYAKLQLEREKQPLKPGSAFEVVRRLLALNEGSFGFEPPWIAQSWRPLGS